MYKKALVVYFLWLAVCLLVCVLGFFFDLGWALILGGIACLIVPAEKVRIHFIKQQASPLSKNVSWTLILLMLVVPTLFGLWSASQVELEPEQHRANILVIWLLFYSLFPLCLYSYWFLNKSSWKKLNKKLSAH